MARFGPLRGTGLLAVPDRIPPNNTSRLSTYSRLAYLGDYCEVSVGAQVALNGAAQPGDRAAVIGLIEVFYDELFPTLVAWKPF